MYKIIGANQTEYGPVSAEQVRQWIAEGRINAQTSAQAVGDTGWKPISSFPEFASSFPSAPPSGAPSSPPTFSAATAPSPGDRAQAVNQVSAPAICLIVIGGLTIGFGVLTIIAQMFGLAAHAFDNLGNQNPEMQRILQGSGGVLGIVFAILRMALGGFVIYGGLKMKALQQHGVAMGAAIVSVIPCCLLGPCCCLSIPVGIWALVVLNKAEVRNQFS